MIELSDSKMRVWDVYTGNDRTATRRLLSDLDLRGEQGKLAAALFRAQKASARAKEYRGDSVDYSYGRKAEQLTVICDLLSSTANGLIWGWGQDKSGNLTDVLYIDLPCGQVSFHSESRLVGPDYLKPWDSGQNSAENVMEFASQVLDEHAPNPKPKRSRTQKPKKEFICDGCGTRKMSSQSKPPRWVEFWHGDDLFACSEECRRKSVRERDNEMFCPEYTLPSGKHEGELLREVEESYLTWISENVDSPTSILRRAAVHELLRRRVARNATRPR